jgi:8-oxo-dGTP diphosphatase
MVSNLPNTSPGGRQNADESPQQGALRELREECNITGIIVRQTSHVCHAPDDETYSFLVDIGVQTPALGHDPELSKGLSILADVKWMSLAEIPERDRVFLWEAGLRGVGDFLTEIERWGDETSYPGKENPNNPDADEGL